jgi:uracil-DNA glycosylase
MDLIMMMFIELIPAAMIPKWSDCRECKWLAAEIDLVQPKVIISLGISPLYYFRENPKETIKDWLGKTFKYGDIIIIPTSWFRKGHATEKDFDDVMIKLKEVMNDNK